MYLYAREGLDQTPTTLQPRNPTPGGYGFGLAPSAVEGFGQPPPVDPGIQRIPPKNRSRDR